ncbi:MAG: hypothetical protein RL346_2127 [Verrucomicrobiota bacterium]|jgi:hypothetical protein
MNSSQIKNRLVQLVGESEAFELLESPNADLDGLTPQSLLDAGNLAPIKTLLESLELREKARRKWIDAERQYDEPLEIEMLIPDYQRGAIQSLPENRVARVLQILDEIQIETLRENSFEREAAK